MARKGKQEIVVDLGHGSAAYLLPDEDPDAYRDLREEIFVELSPKTTRRRLVADNLVDVEWDIARHRRMLAAVTRSGFRRQAESMMGRLTWFSTTMSITASQYENLTPSTFRRKRNRTSTGVSPAASTC